MVDGFIDYILHERRYSALTARNYRNDIAEFLAYVGTDAAGFVPQEHLTAQNVRGWIMSLSEGGHNAPATVNRKVSALRSFYRWLRKHDFIGRDPFVGIKALKTPMRLPSFVPETTIAAAVDALRCGGDGDFETRRNSLIVLLFYATGIRLAELAGIRIADFSAGFSRLRVVGKGDKERVVPVVESVRREASDFISSMKAENICSSDENLLFLTKKGEPVSRSGIYRVVRGWLRAAGVQGKASPHVLRHTFATHMLGEGADMREIQEILGHSSLRATEVYTHNDVAQLKETYNKAHPRAAKK